MNAKQYEKKKTALYNKFGAVKSEASHEVQINTKFGIVYISSEWIPSIKVANIHSKLMGNLSEFKEATNYPINTYNGKCNFYYSDPLEALDELEEYLGNLQFLN